MVKTQPLYLLGISAYYHDAAAALIKDGIVVAAAEEERFSRVKHDSSFPQHAVEYCLKEAGITLAEVNAVVFYEKPLLKFERILETILMTAPRGRRRFAEAMRSWMSGKLFFEGMLRGELEEITGYTPSLQLLFSEHHLSHAASAFYPSPFQDAAVLTIDGVGEWTTGSIMSGSGATLTTHEELLFPHSVGLFYSSFTEYLGFKVNDGEYKLMGLAPYAVRGSEEVERYKHLILEHLLTLAPDGSIFLHQEYFEYTHGTRTANGTRWENLFGFTRRAKDEELAPHHATLACAAQEVLEEIVLRMARHAQEVTGSKNLCLAGGVALNCVANATLRRSGLFETIWVQPAAGDAGGALGAALAAHHLYFGKERQVATTDSMQGAYLGPSFSDNEIETVLRSKGVTFEKMDTGKLCETIAKHIARGSIVGWFQGRMEFGPRALGNRSILGDPRDPSLQKRLNEVVKAREGFRPFAPAVLEEEVGDYFDTTSSSPYMLFTAQIVEKRRKKKPDDYASFSLREKLTVPLSDMPAITHVDYSARLQTVAKTTNPLFHELLTAFKRETGYGVLVNTSFNRNDEPIVATPEDAYRAFVASGMDALVIGSYLVLK